MLRFYFPLLLLFFIPALQAQESLRGQLVDEAHLPIPFATVLLYAQGDSNLYKGEVSDDQGRFVFKQVRSGAYDLRISSIGYGDYQRHLTLTKEPIDLGEVVLLADVEVLETVAVVAKKPIFERKTDRTIVNVQNSASSAGSNALEILERAPGVHVDRINNTLSLMGKNGVIVTINGKRSRLETDALVQMLAATPEGNIEKIELITNPPASFDADGDGGVINIVLSQSQDLGTNGQLNLFGGYGERGKFGGNANINLKRDKWTAYGQFSSSNDFTQQNMQLLTRIQYPDQLLHSAQDNHRPAYLAMHSGRVGLDWQLSEQTSHSIFVAGSKRVWEMEAEGTTDYLTPYEGLSREVLRSKESNQTDHYMISNHLEHQFDEGHSLSFDYDYLFYEIDNPTDYELQTWGEQGTVVGATQRFASSKLTPFSFHVLKADYARPWGEKHKLEGGLKATISQVDNITRLQYTEPQVFEDPMFTDRIAMQESIYAAYLSTSGPLFAEALEFSLGLRYEYANTDLISANEGDLIGRQLGRLFPTIHLSRQVSEQTKVTLAYNERINRPGFQTLAPAFYFFDRHTILAGNINALPSISRTIQADLNVGTLFLSLSFTDEDNPLSWGQPELNDQDHLLILSPSNTFDRQLATLTASFPWQITPFWSSRFNASGFWRKEVPFIEGRPVSIARFNAWGNVTNTWSFAKSWETELTTTWNSPVNNGLATFRARISFNLGIQKKFANQSKLSLSWTDLFNNGSFFALYADQPQAGIFYDWTYQMEGDIFRLSYTIPFGNQQLKTKGPRKAGSEDIQQRATN